MGLSVVRLQFDDLVVAGNRVAISPKLAKHSSTGFIGECIVGFQFDCLVEAGQGFLETPESEQRVASIVMGIGGPRIDSDCLVEKFKAAFELAALALNHAEQVHGIKMVWIGLQYLFAKIPRFSEFALLEQGNGLLKERLCVTVAV